MRSTLIWQFACEDAKNALPVRRTLLQTLRQHRDRAFDEETAEIIFSELVANVVRHAPGPIRITLELTDSTAILTVQDRGPGFTLAPSLPPNVYSEGGRGLFIVAQYALDVRVERLQERGASVRVTFSLDGSKQRRLIRAVS